MNKLEPAKKAYNMYLEEISEKLDQMKEQLKPPSYRELDWRDVGDLGHVNALLTEVVEFLKR